MAKESFEAFRARKELERLRKRAKGNTSRVDMSKEDVERAKRSYKPRISKKKDRTWF